MKLKYIAAAAAVLASSSAFAEVTGNVGVTSDYMFRGLAQGTASQNGEAAVQGGIDWAGDSGLYFGTWGSNVGVWGGGTEVDWYGGYSGTAGAFSYDIGAIYYWYPEEDETNDLVGEDAYDNNTIEYSISGSYSFFTVKYAYTDDWFGSDKSASYLNGAASFPVTDSTTLDVSVGYSFGDFWKDADSEYEDFSIGLTTAVTDSFSASFAYVDTDGVGESVADFDDKPKFVISATYTFGL